MFLRLLAGYRRANRASGGGQSLFIFFLEGPVLVTVNIEMLMLALTFLSDFLFPEKSSITNSALFSPRPSILLSCILSNYYFPCVYRLIFLIMFNIVHSCKTFCLDFMERRSVTYC